MRAEEVYDKHKNRIRRMAHQTMISSMNPQEKVFDKKGNTDILFTGSKTDITEEMDYINQITYELRGIHTACRVIPIDDRDIRMICTEVDKEDALELEKCLEPIRKRTSRGIGDFGRELIDLSHEQSKKLREGRVRTPREARRELAREAHEKDVITPLLDIVESFENYKDMNCKPIKKVVSEVIVKGKKVTIVR